MTAKDTHDRYPLRAEAVRRLRAQGKHDIADAALAIDDVSNGDKWELEDWLAFAESLRDHDARRRDELAALDIPSEEGVEEAGLDSAANRLEAIRILRAGGREDAAGPLEKQPDRWPDETRDIHGALKTVRWRVIDGLELARMDREFPGWNKRRNWEEIMEEARKGPQDEPF